MSEMKMEKIAALRLAADQYAKADAALERACGQKLDPIACTVFALKKRHVETLPEESFDAAASLEQVVKLHKDLVFSHKMDNDEVRAIWFPILNYGNP